MRRSCENYYKVNKNKKKVDDTIEKLAKDKNVVVLKQDKGRGVVLLNKTRYIEKCMEHLNTPNFHPVEDDTTNKVEDAVKRALGKIKNIIGEEDYKKIYPTGSNPGKFYGTAKVHKVKTDEVDKVGKLPLRPIVSNIGTATHKTARYLCKLLTPLGKSKYTMENTKEFVEKIRTLKVPKGYVMVSFDVVSLFTNVPLDKTIDIILRKIYKEKKIKTKIPKEDMRELLYLCTKGVPFMFNGKMYTQVDGVMMGSPLGALFANIFMNELETKIVPKLRNLKEWTRYVDDTFALIKPNKEKEIQEILNGFHNNIKFTYENEDNKEIAFLDVLLSRRDDGKLETKVYRKSTNTDIYMNWHSHAPPTWKISTLKCLVKRAFMISSKEEYLQEELAHLKKVFTEYNQYPKKIVEEVIQEETTKQNTENEPVDKDDNNDDEGETVTLSLPYIGEEGTKIMTKMKKDLKKANEKMKVRIVYDAKKLGSRFKVKDDTQPKHQHNIVYHATCANKKCESNYIGETGRRLLVRATDHNRRDKQSHLLKHASGTKHRRVWLKDFKIIGSGYKSKFKRRISESLYIKAKKPDLNIQKDAYRLALFN